jgi:hypothetical protein
MIPYELLKNDAVQVVIGLLLLAWEAWLTLVVIGQGREITALNIRCEAIPDIHKMMTNHYHDLPERVKELERRAGITNEHS